LRMISSAPSPTSTTFARPLVRTRRKSAESPSSKMI
jgi:hypothetical protein